MHNVRTRTSRGLAGFAGAVATVLLGLLAAVPAAQAEGTGVNFAALEVPGTLPAKEARLLAAEEAAYQKWLAERGGDGSITIQAVDTPYYYLWTPSHKQKNGYYCGPATCQIIDDYWGDYVSQDQYAAKYGMCPDSNGTIYSLMDDVLRYYTGKKYNYYSGISSSDDFYDRVQYGLYTKHYPESVLIRIDTSRHDWSPYRYSHAGHIVCVEAFDWRLNADGERIIRFNDPYNEADYYAGGGSTYGHQVYRRGLVWAGLDETPCNAMIY